MHCVLCVSGSMNYPTTLHIVTPRRWQSGLLSGVLWCACRSVCPQDCMGKSKVKFSHTRYRALGPELIPVYRQSARRWREVNHAIAFCHACVYLRSFHQMALPVNGSTHLISAYYSFYRPRKDERMSWPSWLTCSGLLTHISGHPSAAGRAQDRESSPARDRRSTTVPRHQLHG